MRTRKKKLSDYGIPKEDEKKLYQICRNLSEKDENILFQAALSACSPFIAICVIESLTKKKGYDTLSKEGYIPATKDDFYAYRRKTLDGFYRLLKLNQRWER